MDFRTYDSVEEMFANIEAGVKQAQENTTPEQKAITKGDYWWRYLPEWELDIFGYIETDEELYSSSAYYGVSKREIEAEKQSAAYNYDRGFRFGRAYSTIVPNGELGDTHVSTMTKISKEQFELAKANNWSIRLDEEVFFPFFAGF